MVKKIINFGVMLVMVFSLAACKEDILRHFDLTDPKEFWIGTIDDDFAEDTVILGLRRTSTFPELELRHFRLENAERVEYLDVRPPDHLNEAQRINFRQIVFLRLKQHGKEEVVEAIRHLETLKFVKWAEPNLFGTFT